MLRDAQCTDRPRHPTGRYHPGRRMCGPCRLDCVDQVAAIVMHDGPDPADGEDVRRRRTPHGNERLQSSGAWTCPEASIEEQDLAVVSRPSKCGRRPSPRH